MRKISTLLLAAAICTTANADETKLLTMGIGTPGVDEPGLIGQGISPNGKYVCGNIEMGGGYFVINLENNEIAWNITEDEVEGSELRHVDNNGLAIGYDGPGITFNIAGDRTVLQTPSGEYKYVLGEALSNDGSIMIGELIGTGFITYAGYSVDGGEWKMLPQGDEATVGKYAKSGSTAKQISGDGKVILGQVGGNLGPSVLWIKNEKGEYELDPIFTKLPEENLTGDKAFFDLAPNFVSDNGKYVLMTAITMIGDDPEMAHQTFVPVVYNTETKAWTIYNEPQEVDYYQLGLTAVAIDNNGNIIGIIGQPGIMASGTFYLKAGETQARTYSEAFPSYGEILSVGDSVGYSIPTSMSADGRYLIGFAFYSDDYYDEYSLAYWATYVIDTEDNTGIAAPSISEGNAKVDGIYSIDGKRLQRAAKGVNIIRMTDGTVRKVINK